MPSRGLIVVFMLRNGFSLPKEIKTESKKKRERKNRQHERTNEEKQEVARRNTRKFFFSLSVWYLFRCALSLHYVRISRFCLFVFFIPLSSPCSCLPSFLLPLLLYILLFYFIFSSAGPNIALVPCAFTLYCLELHLSRKRNRNRTLVLCLCR